MAEAIQNDPSRLVGVKTGVVRSKGTDKTIQVVMEALVKHPQYGKFIRTRTKLAVHDPGNAAKEGDVVEIVPCRRMSKTKCWRLVRVVRAGVGKLELPNDIK